MTTLLSNSNPSDLLPFIVILESQGQICNCVLMKHFLSQVTGKNGKVTNKLLVLLASMPNRKGTVRSNYVSTDATSQLTGKLDIISDL